MVGFIIIGALIIATIVYTQLETISTPICQSIEKGLDIDSDHCIKAIAVWKKDAGMCEGIAGEDFITTNAKGQRIQIENPPKSECFLEIAAKTNNPNLCDKATGVFVSANKIDCLYAVALQNKDAYVCERIGIDTQSRAGIEMNQADCKNKVARLTGIQLTQDTQTGIPPEAPFTIKQDHEQCAEYDYLQDIAIEYKDSTGRTQGWSARSGDMIKTNDNTRGTVDIRIGTTLIHLESNAVFVIPCEEGKFLSGGSGGIPTKNAIGGIKG